MRTGSKSLKTIERLTKRKLLVHGWWLAAEEGGAGGVGWLICERGLGMVAEKGRVFLALLCLVNNGALYLKFTQFKGGKKEVMKLSELQLQMRTPLFSVPKEDTRAVNWLTSMAILLRQASQLGILRVQILKCSYGTLVENQLSIHRNANAIGDPLNTINMSQYSEEAGGINEERRGKSMEKKMNILINTLGDLKDSKQAVYGALDSWVAQEQSFPIGRLKAALLNLERENQWHRVVQVIKWMLSKGQSNTIGTYGQLIRALDMDQRVEEAQKVWEKKVGRDLRSVPWKVCDIMISVYYRNNMLKEVVCLFKSLEAYDRIPQGKSIVQKVAYVYEKLGLVEEKEQLLEKYKSLYAKTRTKRSKESWSKKKDKSAERISDGFVSVEKDRQES